jgi:hypothetical protein
MATLTLPKSTILPLTTNHGSRLSIL